MIINNKLQLEDPNNYVSTEEKEEITIWIEKIKVAKLDNGLTLYEHSGKRQNRTPEEFYNHMYNGKVIEFYVYHKLSEQGIKTTSPTFVTGGVDAGDLIHIHSGKKISIKYSKYREESWLFNKWDSCFKESQLFIGLKMQDDKVGIRCIVDTSKLKFKSPRVSYFRDCYAVYASDLLHQKAS